MQDVARNYKEDTDFAIGLTLNSLVSLRLIGVGVPDQVTYQRASTYYTAANMSRIGDGFAVATWVWDVISVERLSKLLTFLGGENSASVYIRTDERDALHAQPHLSFKVYSAIMWKPVLSGQEGTPIVRSPYALQSVQIKFLGMVEQVGYI